MSPLRPSVCWLFQVLSVITCLLLGASGEEAGALDVVEISAQDITDGYLSGAFSAVEVTQAFLDRISKYEPNYNALTWFNPDALSEATRVDQELATSGLRGPLDGIPVVIKESMDIVGAPSTFGYAPFSSATGGVDLFPVHDSTVVARLKEAGAIILGKTNIPAFSFDRTRAETSWAGRTYNAVDRSLAPGASSSGTGTAVAASFAVLGLGEEPGGSIQDPAAAQQLVGIKPTFGLVPNTGVVPLSASNLDVVGPMARTVYDAALGLDFLAGPSVEDPKTAVAEGHIPVGGIPPERADVQSREIR